jgi:hypothetical protein
MALLKLTNSENEMKITAKKTKASDKLVKMVLGAGIVEKAKPVMTSGKITAKRTKASDHLVRMALSA